MKNYWRKLTKLNTKKRYYHPKYQIIIRKLALNNKYQI